MATKPETPEAALAAEPAVPSLVDHYFTSWYEAGIYPIGAQFLTELAPLCKIYCSDGEEYTMSSCVTGQLMEVNESILHKPSILQEKPSTEGNTAVVLPKFEESKSITEGLLTQKQYDDVVVKRINATTATS
eukprot:XP_028338116.1 protein Simiate-like [Physeter catodon]